MNVLGCGLALAILSGCSPAEIQPVPIVETRTVEIKNPAPIVPSIDQLKLRDVQWKIVTPDNIDEIFQSVAGDVVLFAITADGYEALALNLSDLRMLIQQQQQVIMVYKNSYL